MDSIFRTQVNHVNTEDIIPRVYYMVQTGKYVPKFRNSLEPSSQSAGIISRRAAQIRQPKIQHFSPVFGMKVMNFIIHSANKSERH